MPDAIRVFISYSHDSRHHQQRVLSLSNRLREDGIDCSIDQYEVSPPEGWPAWMSRRIQEANFVLVVCTQTYLRRLEGDEVPGIGLGARFESMLSMQEIYKANSRNEKFIPVVFRPDDQRYVPNLFAGTIYCLEQPDGYEQLFRHILGIPSAERPPIGKLKSEYNLRSFDPRQPHPDFFFFVKDRVHYPPGPMRSETISGFEGTRSNLPTALDFVGRAHEVEEVKALLQTGAKVVLLRGPFGVGKSALALEVAHQLQGRSEYRAFIWVSVGPEGLTLSELFNRMAGALEYDYVLRLQPEDKKSEITKILEISPSLITIVGFESIGEPGVEQFLKMLPDGTQVLVTGCESAPRMAVPINIASFTDSDAVVFARNEVGRMDPAMLQDLDLAGLDRICRLGQNIPLAIQLVVGQLRQADSPNTAITAMEEACFDSIGSIFRRAWSVLSEPAKRTLMTLSLFADSPIAETLRAITGNSEPETQEALVQLLALRLAWIPMDEGAANGTLPKSPEIRTFSPRVCYPSSTHRPTLPQGYDSTKLLASTLGKPPKPVIFGSSPRNHPDALTRHTIR
jgi:TIR domain/NB-ARC domain